MQVVGSAIAVSLLTYGAVPLWAGVLITAVASFVLLLLERLGIRNLEALFAVLIGVMAVSFGVMYIMAGVPTADVIEGAHHYYLLHLLLPSHAFTPRCRVHLQTSCAWSLGVLIHSLPRAQLQFLILAWMK